MAKVTRLSCNQDVSHTADWLDDQPVSVDVPEDEATGSAALRLAAQLGTPIQIRQGPTAGSLIYARPLEDGRAEVGGAVVLDEVRD